MKKKQQIWHWLNKTEPAEYTVDVTFPRLACPFWRMKKTAEKPNTSFDSLHELKFSIKFYNFNEWEKERERKNSY